MEKKQPKLVIKSEYNYLYEFLDRNGVTTFILLILLIISIKANLILTYLIIVSIYIAFIILSTVYNKLQYNANVYKFYDDKIIYTNSFINKESKRIKFEDIKEVRVNQMFLQIPFKLGTIVISTNSGKFLDNGILIFGVKNINETYQKIEDIIEEWQKQQSK